MRGGVPSGVLLGLWCLRLVWRSARARLLLMLISQAGVAVATGAGFAAFLAALDPEELTVRPLVLVGFGAGCLVVAALLDFVGMTTSFGLRWKLQSELRDEVVARVRGHGCLVLPPPLRPNSTIGVSAAAGIGAAHTAWMTQLLLNGIMPLLVAFMLGIVISFQAPLILVAILAMVLLALPLVWLQVRRVSSAAGVFLDSAAEKSRALRKASQEAIDGLEPSTELVADVATNEDARRARMAGVQWLRLGTGVLLAVSIGGCVLLLRDRPLELAELAILIALLRAALVGVVGVARAAGNAARVQPKAELLRRTLHPDEITSDVCFGVDSITVHGVEPPDWLARFAAVAHHFGGVPSGGLEVRDDLLRIRMVPDAAWITVFADGRKPSDGSSDLHLAITSAGEVQVWAPNSGEPGPEIGSKEVEMLDSNAMEGDDEEGPY